MHIEPQVLIISNKFDFSTDFITNKLNELDVAFLRLNRDDLKEYKIDLDPFSPSLYAYIDGFEFRMAKESLKSIYYRAPTFLREIFQEKVPAEEQLYKTQWAAFVRSLVIFENVKWVNNPVATYKAEMKPYQLYYAKKVGFNIPETLITNYSRPNIVNSSKIAIKSIDTAIVSNDENEAFIYTNIIDSAELTTTLFSSPFFIQEGLIPKVDIRITIIGETIIPIKIFSNEGITEDWRKHKGSIKYEVFDLPGETKQLCLDLANGLGLNFCAIDMIEHKNKYYFIEVNPTGEWAWLQKNTGYEFDAKIAEMLI